jgi:caffeoyl-CoA O-methyltransferase
MDQATTEALTGYVRDLFAPEDDALRWILEESEARGLPRIHIRADEGQMLQFLVRAVGAKRAVEIGTLAGYSGTWIARGLAEGGKLVTLDNNPDHASLAEESFKRAGVADRVEIRVGDAKKSLAELAKDGPYDALFIDADRPSYSEYLAWGIENVQPGGLIAAHNAFFGGSVVGVSGKDIVHVDAVKAFNKALASDARLYGTIIPLGDGIAAAIRR